MALLLALVSGYVSETIVDSGQFTSRATTVLDDGAARTLIATRITDQLVSIDEPVLSVARPIIQTAVGAAVASRAFADLFAAGVRELHAALLDRRLTRLSLTVGDLGSIVGPALSLLPASLAGPVRSADDIVLISRHVGSLTATIADVAQIVGPLSAVLGVVSVVLAAVALALPGERPRTLRNLGLSVAGVGLLAFLALLIGRSAAISQVQGQDARATVGAVWDAYLADLRVLVLVMAGAGVAVVALASAWTAVRSRRHPLARS
ncbi:MAG: hypothetical protein ACLP50_18855 [Solirubrobacteraceae bacterium]